MLGHWFRLNAMDNTRINKTVLTGHSMFNQAIFHGVIEAHWPSFVRV